MRVVSYYHKDTGIFDGQQVIVSADSAIEAHIPADHIAIDGHHDPLSKRVDVAAHQQFLTLHAEPTTHLPRQDRAQHQAECDALWAKVLVDYVPPPPSADHEWNAETKRWEHGAAWRAKQAARASAITKIAELEQSQHGLVRALLALGDLSAIGKLRAIYHQIELLQHLYVNEKTSFGLAPPPPPLPDLPQLDNATVGSLILGIAKAQSQLLLPAVAGDAGNG